MNKKLLALLLLAPLGFFAADQALGLSLGAGMKLAKPLACIETDVFEGQEGVSMPEFMPLATLPPEEQDRLRLLAREKSSALESKYPQEVLIGIDFAIQGDTRLDASMDAFLGREVQAVMNLVDPFQLELEDEFSRCGSGYHYGVIASDGALTGKGFLIRDSGCEDRAFGIFRVDFASSKVGVVLPGTQRMLSIADFLELLAQG